MPNVEQTIRPLKQSDFQSKIIYDPMETIRGEGREAVFLCDNCNNTFQNNIHTEKKKKVGWCRECLYRVRYPEYYKKNDIIDYLKKHGSKSESMSGFFGVRRNRYVNSFVATIKEKGYQITIGTADTAEEAAYLYDKYVLDNFLDRQLNYEHHSR